MEDTTFIYKVPEKRRIWVSIILSLFKPGLAMIYCSRLKQGIYTEISLTLLFSLFGILVALIPEFLMVVVVLILTCAILIGILVYNIKLTIKTNRLKIPRLRKTWGLIVLVGILSAVADEGASILVKGNFIEAYKIPASSMENTLLTGDYFMVAKNIDPANLRSGDLIVFKYPGDPRRSYAGKGTNYVKRLIAREGQTVEIVDKKVFVDGEPFDEPSTVKIDSVRILPHYRNRYQWGPGNRDNIPEIVVPEGKLFVMGDNRDDSSDSRFWGYVDVEDVIGRPRFIHFSWDPEKSHVRLERIGMRLDD